MNINILDIMAPAFVECLVLIGIHSYFGIHVIKRNIVFVDLALAQVAALGTTIAFLFGIMPNSAGAYWFSIGFTTIGAAIFSISRFRYGKVPQEAIIGLVYVISAAIAILVTDRAPHGAEHIKELLTGSILWVKWKTIFHTAIVYLLVGIFHFLFRNKFMLITNDVDKAWNSGVNVYLWDFLFYLSFGIVITHSVGTAGVLLVFTFLIAPSIIAVMLTDVFWKQLLFGWGLGLVVSVVALYLSYIADLPSGPTVIAIYGLSLILISLILYVWRSVNKKMALFRIFIGMVILILVSITFILLGRYFGNNM